MLGMNGTYKYKDEFLHTRQSITNFSYRQTDRLTRHTLLPGTIDIFHHDKNVNVPSLLFLTNSSYQHASVSPLPFQFPIPHFPHLDT